MTRSLSEGEAALHFMISGADRVRMAFRFDAVPPHSTTWSSALFSRLSFPRSSRRASDKR